MSKTVSITVAGKKNPLSPDNSVFGPEWGGIFAIRRPSILEAQQIDLRQTAMLNSYGVVDKSQVADLSFMTTYLTAVFLTVADEKLPEWWNPAALPDEEEVLAVITLLYQEVRQALKTFRQKSAGGQG